MSIIKATYMVCDGPACLSKIEIEDNRDPVTYIPSYWIKTNAPSNEFIWETKMYHLCSRNCYEALMDDISDLMAEYNEGGQFSEA